MAGPWPCGMDVDLSSNQLPPAAKRSGGRLKWSTSLVACLLQCPCTSSAGEIGWQTLVEVVRGAGERGVWQQNESRYDFVDDPTVAWSRGGELAVAWVDQRRKAVLCSATPPMETRC